MSRFNTGNPLGSGDPRDLDDNAKNFDEAINTEDPNWVDRFGRFRMPVMEQERQFLASQEERGSQFQADQLQRENEFDAAQDDREQRFNTFISSSGYQFIGDYGPGIEFTEYNQLVRDENGEFWRVSGQVDLPYVTTGAGIPEGDALVPAGDAVLRQDLDNPDKGAAMVARAPLCVDSIADLLALPEGQKKEGVQYLVRGYHAGTDVGGGDLYWDPNSTEQEDFVSVFSSGLGAGRFIRTNRGDIDIYKAGARADGSSVETDVFLRAVVALPPRGILRLRGAHLLVRAGEFHVADKPRITIDGEGATIEEDGPNTFDTLVFERCDHLKIRDITPVGKEDLAYWQSTDTGANGRCSFFRVIQSKRPKIYEIHNGGFKRGLIFFDSCRGQKAFDIDWESFLPDGETEGWVTDANYISTVRSTGDFATFYDIHGENVGNVLLTGSDSKGTTAFAITGENIHDNIVYVSSGHRCRVFATDGTKVRGQIVKTRGSLNVVFGNTGDHTDQTAFSQSGNGTVVDEYGANGHGNILALNTAADCGKSLGGALSMSEQDGYYLRDSIMAFNAADRAGAAGHRMLLSIQVRGGIVVGNSMGSTAGDFAALIQAPAGSPKQSAGILALNSFYGNPTDSVMRLNQVDQMVLLGNLSTSEKLMVSHRFMDDSVVACNLSVNGTAVGFSNSYPSLRNLVMANRGDTGSAGAQGKLNALQMNYPTLGYENPANAPAFTGQLTVFGGVAYIAIGASSPADWKALATV